MSGVCGPDDEVAHNVCLREQVGAQEANDAQLHLLQLLRGVGVVPHHPPEARDGQARRGLWGGACLPLGGGSCWAPGGSCLQLGHLGV